MNCLVCGHKLAIFRKLSLGDFCCQEHRTLFHKEQSEQGLARLMETSSESGKSGGATRVYAQFLPEDLTASYSGADSLSYGPLSPSQVMSPAPQRQMLSRLVTAHAAVSAAPQVGARVPIGYDFTGVGNFGQYLYVSPGSHLIILRNGVSLGNGGWLRMFYAIATALRR